ncbi:copper amine oxidase N-terminal domain-containing protein, partial [Microgenomates group bacterium]|nr:copper amine oxidase N-terminal domain-containing protein [Microgenomates group bacterium]
MAKKTVVLLIIIISVIIGALPFSAQAATSGSPYAVRVEFRDGQRTLTVGGQRKTWLDGVLPQDGYVPLRSYCDHTGKQVGWNSQQPNIARVTVNDQEFSYVIGQALAYNESGRRITLERSTLTVNGRTMVWYKDLELLGDTLVYNSSTGHCRGSILFYPPAMEEEEPAEPTQPPTQPPSTTDPSRPSYPYYPYYPYTPPYVPPLDYSGLNIVWAQINALNEADWTSESWALFRVAITNAAAMAEDTQTRINAKTRALENALGILTPQQPSGIAVDKSGLDAVLDQIAALAEANYTPPSWSAFMSAKIIADAMAEDTQNQVTAKVIAYNQALTLLVAKQPETIVIDKSGLTAVLDQIAALVETNYTASSWSAFMSAKTAADAMAENTQSAVTAKVIAYNQAIRLLIAVQPPVAGLDLSGLNAALTYVQTLDENDWTSASWATLQDLVAQIQDLLDNDGFTHQSE